MTSKPRVICYDIEASNLDANFGMAICVGFKELGKKAKVLSVMDYPRWKKDTTDDRPLMRDVYDVLMSADLIIGYYSKRFDLPFLNVRMLLAGLKPLPPIPHIDLYDTVRINLKLHRRRLATVTETLGIDDEVDEAGETTIGRRKTPITGNRWIRAIAGHVPSVKYIIDHCHRDVNALEAAYLRLRPFIRLHPNLAASGRFRTKEIGVCRYCGGEHLEWRGYRITRTNRQRRVQCGSCGAWDVRIAS